MRTSTPPSSWPTSLAMPAVPSGLESSTTSTSASGAAWRSRRRTSPTLSAAWYVGMTTRARDTRLTPPDPRPPSRRGSVHAALRRAAGRQPRRGQAGGHAEEDDGAPQEPRARRRPLGTADEPDGPPRPHRRTPGVAVPGHGLHEQGGEGDGGQQGQRARRPPGPGPLGHHLGGQEGEDGGEGQDVPALDLEPVLAEEPGGDEHDHEHDEHGNGDQHGALATAPDRQSEGDEDGEQG